MKSIEKFADKYEGNADIAVQFKDYDNGEVVFNLYVQINENDIMKMTPMLPEEMPEKDITVELNFNEVYELIETSQKEMEGGRIESPPWAKKSQPMQAVKEVYNGVKMFFKVRSMISNAAVEPKSEKKDVQAMVTSFFSMMMSKGGDNGQQDGQDDRNSEEQSDSAQKGMSGKVVFYSLPIFHSLLWG